MSEELKKYPNFKMNQNGAETKLKELYKRMDAYTEIAYRLAELSKANTKNIAFMFDEDGKTPSTKDLCTTPELKKALDTMHLNIVLEIDRFFQLVYEQM